jgi:hypothetical protein
MNWYLLATLGVWTGVSSAEKVELTTTYPTPSGVYAQIVTTGAGGRNTRLCRDSGNVGIGVKNPSKKLDVAGNGRFSGTLSAGSVKSQGTLRAGGLAADPAGSNGMIYYNTTSNKLRAFINGSWRTLGEPP